MAFIRALITGLLVLTLAGCAATYRHHGYVPSDSELEQIIVGVDTRESVAEVLGNPTAAGIVASSGYYYVRDQRRQWAYRAPEVIDREVVAVTFDGRGVVENIERFGLEKGRVVRLSRRTTQSETKGIGFLRQLFGNLGNFNIGEFL